MAEVPAGAPRTRTPRLRGAKASGPREVNLALQGGGSHGAFTWGVLDALLEDGRLAFEGASGTSAGAMNAVVLAHALTRARLDGLKGQDAHEAARAALSAFWGQVGLLGNFSAGLPLPAAQAVASWWAQWLSPAQTNPLGVNPLRTLLGRQVDFELLARGEAMKVFVCATNVRTGVGEVFSDKRLTVDAVMASACLPTVFKPVEIKGELYWDGGYSGNPAIYPLIYNTRSSDVVLVQINPVAVKFDASAGAQDIMDRVNEITFNAPLLAEFRAIDFVARLLDEGRLDPARYKKMLLHRVDGGAALAGFGATSKLRADAPFLQRLFELGRGVGQRWLKTHVEHIGVQSTATEAE